MFQKYTLADGVFEAGQIFEFVRSVERYCSSRRKQLKQPMLIFQLFLEPRIRSEISWDEMEEILGWRGYEGLPTKRTTIADKLRDICFDMCVSIDPMIQRPYNFRHISLKTIRNSGMGLCKLTHYRDQPINLAIKNQLTKRVKSLTVKGTGSLLSKGEIHELDYIHKFLGLDPDQPFEMMGPYRIEKELGHGSTGHVFSARHEYTGEGVAIKLLNADLALDQARRDRFFRGAQAMMRLTHPFVVKILDVGDIHNGRPYYVAELVPGGTLADVIEKNQLSLFRRREILGAILCALSEAHNKGIVHRDLKPENILIDQSGNPKITDFDCAYISDVPTITIRYVPGTIRYMSPERLDLPTARDPDDDVYAFGIIALELLSGNRQKSTNEMIRIVSHIPEFKRLHMVLMHCIIPRAHGRYADAKILESHWKVASGSEILDGPSIPALVRPNTAINYGGRDLSGQIFDEMFLPRSNFRNAILRGCSFRRSVLSSVVLMGADIRDCCFDGAFMIGARLHNTLAKGATFKLANLERSVWDDVDLMGVDFTGANLWGSFLRKSLNLEAAILDQTNFSRNELSPEQQQFLDKSLKITRTDNYRDFFSLADTRFGGKFPEELWWSKLIDDPDFMLYYY